SLSSSTCAWGGVYDCRLSSVQPARTTAKRIPAVGRGLILRRRPWRGTVPLPRPTHRWYMSLGPAAAGKAEREEQPEERAGAAGSRAAYGAAAARHGRSLDGDLDVAFGVGDAREQRIGEHQIRGEVQLVVAGVGG